MCLDGQDIAPGLVREVAAMQDVQRSLAQLLLVVAAPWLATGRLLEAAGLDENDGTNRQTVPLGDGSTQPRAYPASAS